jgi:hypothetical protein
LWPLDGDEREPLGSEEAGQKEMSLHRDLQMNHVECALRLSRMLAISLGLRGFRIPP